MGCNHCREGFTEYLCSRYGAVENLNERWNLNLFSWACDFLNKFRDIAHTWNSPHLKFEWNQFLAQSYQVAILVKQRCSNEKRI